MRLKSDLNVGIEKDYDFFSLIDGMVRFEPTRVAISGSAFTPEGRPCKEDIHPKYYP